MTSFGAWQINERLKWKILIWVLVRGLRGVRNVSISYLNDTTKQALDVGVLVIYDFKFEVSNNFNSLYHKAHDLIGGFNFLGVIPKWFTLHSSILILTYTQGPVLNL